MRLERSVLSLTWIPSEAIKGALRLPFDLGVAHYDDPPPDVVTDPGALLAADLVRFANELRAWVEVEDGRIVDHAYSGRGHINVSTLHLAGRTVSFAAIAMPDLQSEPEKHEDSVTFVQTAGGRTGAPLPRRVTGKPFFRVSAPVAWTTLALTIDSTGKATTEVRGASPFPRHWIYDSSGQLVSKTGSIDFDSWSTSAFGKNTPWGDTDSPAFVTSVETALERQLSLQIMRGGARPSMRSLVPGETLVVEGQTGDSIFLLLDGVLRVEVGDKEIAEVGPGAILGERAVLEGGQRTATLRAVTPCKVAAAAANQLDPRALIDVSLGHHREEQDGPGPGH